MAIKNVVKVMNFHSLLRVDKARRKADMYFDTSTELVNLIQSVLFNHNLILDKNLVYPNDKAPILNIYIGNDYGFCGDFNSSINKEIKEDESFKIIIGKKINCKNDEKILLKVTKEYYFENSNEVETIIYDAIEEKKYKEINIIYNHYHNANRLEFMKKKIYPIDIEAEKEEKEKFTDDFATETEIKTMLNNLVSLCICYEIKICEMNSFAAENLIRQQITREALKKIEEMDEEKAKIDRKLKKQKDFQKIIENYRKV